MNEEQYPSSDETSDEEYVPSDGEKGSEEENSGEDEDFVVGNDDDTVSNKHVKRTRVKAKPTARKRKGGIKLEDDERGAEPEKQDEYNKHLAEQMKQEEVQRKEQDEKKKADSVWADFMSDVGGAKPKPKPSTSGLGSLSCLTKPNTASTKSAAASRTKLDTPHSKKITVTQEFDFAGEIVKVSKEVDANSKEAKTVQAQEQSKSEPQNPTIASALPRFKRTGGGLGSLLGKIGKKPKISTLEKSKLDWENFKSAEGIEEELQIHNRGKDGYIERKQFLERTDMRQFELEKSLRQKNKFL